MIGYMNDIMLILALWLLFGVATWMVFIHSKLLSLFASLVGWSQGFDVALFLSDY
jgi:hypothetical protein